jgi:hypothetical protein
MSFVFFAVNRAHGTKVNNGEAIMLWVVKNRVTRKNTNHHQKMFTFMSDLHLELFPGFRIPKSEDACEVDVSSFWLKERKERCPHRT